MAWWLLIAASAAEIVMALALKYAQGWTRLWPGVLGVAAALGSVFLLTLAPRQLPAGTAYAVWTGIGATGIAVLGIALFGESASLARLACIALIIGGVAGLKALEG